MSRTKRELEIEAYSQKLFAEGAEQKAEDVGHALELLLNDRFKPFRTAITSDRGTHEFLMGSARNVPINNIFRSVEGAISDRRQANHTLENHFWTLRTDRLGLPRNGVPIFAQ
jgi:hypothetical protein